MKRDRVKGTIANVLSIAAHSGMPFLSAYSSSKGALTILIKNVANAVSGLQIRVNGLYKAGIKTGKWEYWYQDGTKRLEDLYENSKKIDGKNNLIGGMMKLF